MNPAFEQKRPHLGDEQPHHPRLGRDVVVADEEEPVVALHEPEHLADGGPEADVRAEPADERLRDHGADVGLDPVGVGLGGEEEQMAQVRVVLRGHRVERLVEPVTRLVHDHDGHDRGHELLVGVHDGARLAGGVRGRRSLTRGTAARRRGA